VVNGRLASVLLGRGNLDEARRHFETALLLDPDDRRLHQQMADLLFLIGDRKGAIEQYREVARLEPANPQVHHVLGSLLTSEGKLAEAEQELAEAVRLKPENAAAVFDRGRVQLQQGKWSEARQTLEQAVRLQPRDPVGHRYLAFVMEQLGDASPAAAEYQSATKLDPDWPRRFGLTAWNLATHPEEKQRNAVRSLEMAQMADSAANHRDPQFLDTLAAAYAEGKRFDDARTTARKALALAIEAKNPEMQKTIEEHLRQYVNDQPVRQQRPKAEKAP
jgi:Flp pilus assembly protein TadD